MTRLEVIAKALRSYSRAETHTTRAKWIEAALVQWEKQA